MAKGMTPTKRKKAKFKKSWIGWVDSGSNCTHGFENSGFLEYFPKDKNLELPFLWKRKNSFMKKYKVTVEEL